MALWAALKRIRHWGKLNDEVVLVRIDVTLLKKRKPVQVSKPIVGLMENPSVSVHMEVE